MIKDATENIQWPTIYVKFTGFYDKNIQDREMNVKSVILGINSMLSIKIKLYIMLSWTIVYIKMINSSP